MSISPTQDGQSSGATRTYRMSAGRQVYLWLLPALGIFFVGIAILAPQISKVPLADDLYPWIVLGGFLFFDMGLYFFVALNQTRIITSPWGIEYYTMGTTIRAPWRNIIGIEGVRMGYETVDSLMVDQDAEMNALMRGATALTPILQPLLWLSALLTGRFWLLFQNTDANKMRRSIPIALFANPLPGSDLMEQIAQYAPQAVGEGGRPAAPAESAKLRPVNNERKTLLGGLAALGLIAAEVLLAILLGNIHSGPTYPPLPGQLWVDAVQTPIALSQNGSTVITGLDVRSFGTSKEVVKMPLPQSPSSTFNANVEDSALSPDGKLAVVGDDQGRATLWQVSDGKLLKTFSVSPVLPGQYWSYVHAVAISPDGKMVAALAPSGAIQLWDAGSGTMIRSMQAGSSAEEIYESAKLAFAANGSLLVSRVLIYTEVWRVADGSTVGKVQPDSAAESSSSTDYITDFSIAADGKTMAFDTDNGVVELDDVQTGKLLYLLHGATGSNGSFSATGSIALSSDGKRLATVVGSALVLWDVGDKTSRTINFPKKQSIAWLGFGPDNKTLLYDLYNQTSDYDHTEALWLWDTSDTATPGPAPAGADSCSFCRLPAGAA